MSLLLGWRAYARDKNTSARLCAKKVGRAYARGGAYLRDTTVYGYVQYIYSIAGNFYRKKLLQISQLFAKVFPVKIVFFTNWQNFTPLKVSRYGNGNMYTLSNMAFLSVHFGLRIVVDV